ncbi:MAG: hypothetical protein WCK67_13040 [bacterium]
MGLVLQVFKIAGIIGFFMFPLIVIVAIYYLWAIIHGLSYF